MFKLLVFISATSVVNSEVSLEWFNGKWVQAVEFPNESWFPLCTDIEFEANTDRHCLCGDKNVSIVTGTLGSPYNRTHDLPVIVVNESSEVQDALKLQCSCDEKLDLAVFRQINDNYFVLYTKHHRQSEVNKAHLMLRKMPKLSEIRQVLKNIDDLSQRSRGYMCDPNLFVNEFEDLD